MITVEDYADFRYRFHKYLTKCFEEIILEIKSIEESEFEYGFYNHLFDCYAKIIDVVDDPSYLKILKLLIDGDVESNPGPTTQTDVNKTPKGRKLKCKSFNFTPKKLHMNNVFAIDDAINRKISVVESDIINVHCDAIVNAANETLLGGSGIDGRIHKIAGPELRNKCSKFPVKELLNGKEIRCYPGECKVTDTDKCKLDSRYVFHTVGPKVENKNMLKHYENILIRCYENCLQNVLDYKIKSIAFCCISTGIYKYDNRDAAHVALNTVRLWLVKNHSFIDQIIFCTYLNTDFKIYQELMAEYFPESTVDKSNDGMYKIPGNISTITSNNSNETPVKGRQNGSKSFKGTSNEQKHTVLTSLVHCQL